jgi:hypothetical protein
MTTGRKITGLPLPETPREAPPEIHGLVEAIEVTLADSDAMAAAQVLGRTFEYLTRYFCGVAGAIAQHLNLPGDPTVALDFAEARKQLQQRMESLGDQATDPLSKLVRGVFYVGATRKAPTPRRHARLLDLGGIPIRGYRNLDEWIAIEPGTGDLSNESKANRELLRYLPILKEWLTATATYFLDAKQSPLIWESPSALSFSFEAEGVNLRVGPVHLPEALAKVMLPRDLRGYASPETAPPAKVDSLSEPPSEAEPASAEAVNLVSAAPETVLVAPPPPPETDPVEPAPAPQLEPSASAIGSEPERAVTSPPADESAPVVTGPESTPLENEPAAAADEDPAAANSVNAMLDIEPIVADSAASGALDSIPVFEPIATLEPTPIPETPPTAAPLAAAAEPVAQAEAETAQPPVDSSTHSNPFETPAPEPVESTVMLRREDFAFANADDQAADDQTASDDAAGPEASENNPFETPAPEPVESTVMLRREDFAFATATDEPAPSDEAGGPVAPESNPFAAPDPEPVESTVMLRREDFALDFGSLATPSIQPIQPVSSAAGEPEEEEALELPALDDESLAPPEPVGRDADVGLATEPTVEPPPPGIPPEAAEVAEPVKAVRVPPVLFKDKEKAVPQISVSAPIELYPVVTGPPPEFFDEIPVDADYPEVLQTALTDLNGAIETNDSLLICGQMQRCFDLMIQFFAGIAGAVLEGIDSDHLIDFEIEDGRFDLETKLELVVASLSALEEYWEGNDAATLIWSAFYDTLLPATDPNSAYLHTRLLGVEGVVPDTFLGFADLCGVVPGKGALAERSACRETVHRYLPILAFWLENATPLFLESEVDFVEEDGGAALSWAASVSGSTLDGTASGFWLEVSANRWNLPRPELAPVFVVGDAPDVLLPVIDELNSSLEKKDFARSGLMVRVGLDFLIQYFAGCAAALWREQGEMSEQAEELYCPEASLEERERLLLMSLGSLSTESSVGASLGKLFSKSSLQYRSLIRRDLPPGMGPVSEWAARRDEVGETDLLIYLPLLRSWLGASNPWFVAGEQLFEEPAEDGRLEGVVAFGDEFLEMVDPEYVIRLTSECLELIAPLAEAEPDAVDGARPERREFTGALPAMPVLTVGPPLLIGHVTRLLESADDRRAANAWLGSAFEYLIQYFAGLCTTVLGGKEAPIRSAALAYFSPKASLREREILLVEALTTLNETASSGTQEKIKAIFYTEDGKLRPHARYLGAAGPGSLNEDEMLLSFWCRTRHKTGTLNTSEYHFAISALISWLDAAKPFFAICEHYAEDPGADGQEEMVVELAEDYLDMVMPDYAIQVPARGYYEILYRETEAAASDDAALFFPDDIRPELLGPKTTELGGISDDTGDLLMGAAAVELGGDDFFGGAAAYDSSDLFSGPAAPKPAETKPAVAPDSPYARKEKRAGAVSLGSTPDARAGADSVKEPLGEEALAEAENEAAGRRRKKKRNKKAELGTAVLELYKKERLEKARKRAEARARKEEAEPTKLAYSLSYRGLKNSKQLGGRCHFGLIELKNAGGGELKGTVEPSHPSVRVTPSRFEGNEVRVTYQIDPSDMPSTGRVGISLNTQDERIELRMERLVPTSWSRERTTSQALAFMSAPAVLYGAYLFCLVSLVMGPDLQNAFNALASLKTPLALSTKVKLWVFAMLAILPGATGVPAAVKVMFSRWDFTVQEETRKIMPGLMMLPTLLMALTLYLTPFWKFTTALNQLPILATKHWLVVLTLGLNLLAAALFSTQTTVWWEDNSDTKVARRAFRLFWVVTIALGIVATFFMSIK